MSKRIEINQKIREYWKSLGPDEVLKKAVKKPKVPSFTRHNGRHKKRLGLKWRSPKGSHGNKLCCPKIGYKRQSSIRFRRTGDGLILVTVYNLKELVNVVNQNIPYKVPTLSRKIGGKKRQEILKIVMENKYPLYIQKSFKKK